MIFSRLKIYILLFFIMFWGGFLVFRLFQKQVIQHEFYLAQAKKQYSIEKEIPPIRGRIFVKDYFGSEDWYPIASNKQVYSVMVIPRNIKDKKGISKELADILQMDQKEIFNQIDNNKAYMPPIKKGLDLDTAKKIEEKHLEGVMLVPGEKRFYPENNLASHVLGFVDAENNGQYGVEGYYDNRLKGEAKKISSGKSAFSSIFNTQNLLEKPEGDDVYLTIDRMIQDKAQEKIKEAVEKHQAKKGSIIIMDPKTGAIWAMASYPDFDPNNFNKYESVDIFKNPSIAEIYEPGSVFKIFCMGAALDLNKVTPQTTNIFGSSVKVGIETIKTATGKPYGKETMIQVLENSDNVAMVWVEQQIGKEKFYEYIKKFGFGYLTGIDADQEVDGEVLPLNQWRDINAATMSFGQGISVTPIQIVAATAAIANGGALMQPYLVSKIIEKDGKEIETKPRITREIISKNTAENLSQMMESVVQHGHGQQAQVPGYRLAGKTGTAQVPKISGRGYEEDVNIGSFVGFGPIEDPAYVMLVKIDNPKGVPWAEDSAAPVFSQMSFWLLNYLQIPPTGIKKT